MAEKLTAQQQQAVEDRGGKLLVSAAAGSGKTKVLVDRILSYLTDPSDPANLDEFLDQTAFFGFEGNYAIATGLGFGAEQGSPILKELMADYQDIPFLLESGEMDLTACPDRNTEVFLRKGLELDGTTQILSDGTLILGYEYLCPLDNATRILHKTKNTLSIHHFDASWQPQEQKDAHDRLVRQRQREIQLDNIRILLRKLLGDAFYEKIKRDIFKKS